MLYESSTLSTPVDAPYIFVFENVRGGSACSISSLVLLVLIFYLLFDFCFRFFDVMVLPWVNIGWQITGELLNVASFGDNWMSVWEPSLSPVASLDTR